MKNKLKSKSQKALYITKCKKISEGWRVASELKKGFFFWQVVLEKNENFTKEETLNYIKRGMRDQKKEKRNVIITAIVMFAALFVTIIFALAKSGAI